MPPPTTTHRPENYSSREDCEIKKCFQTNRCDDDDDDPRPCQRCLDECRELTGNDQTTPDDVSTQPPEIPYIPLADPEELLEDEKLEERRTAQPEAVTAPGIPYSIDVFVPGNPAAEAEQELEDVMAEEQSTAQQDDVTLPDPRADVLAAGSYGDGSLGDGSQGDDAPPADELDNIADKPVRTCLFWCRWRGCARKKTCESCFKECDSLPAVDSATSSPEQEQAARPVDLLEEEVGSGSSADIGELIPVWMPDPLVDRPEVELKIPDPDPGFVPPVVDAPAVPGAPEAVAEPNSDVIVPDNVVYSSDSEHGAQEPCLRHILYCAAECLSVCLKGSTRECVMCATKCFIEMSFYRVEDRSAVRPSTSDSHSSKSLSSNNCAVSCLKPCHRPTSDLCVLCATNCIGLIAAANTTDSPAGADSRGGESVDSVREERGDVVESNVQVTQSNNFCVSYCEEFKQSATQLSKCTTDCCYWHPPCAS
jgi:hypothetical protein